MSVLRRLFTSFTKFLVPHTLEFVQETVLVGTRTDLINAVSNVSAHSEASGQTGCLPARYGPFQEIRTLPNGISSGTERRNKKVNTFLLDVCRWNSKRWIGTVTVYLTTTTVLILEHKAALLQNVLPRPSKRKSLRGEIVEYILNCTKKIGKGASQICRKERKVEEQKRQGNLLNSKYHRNNLAQNDIAGKLVWQMRLNVKIKIFLKEPSLRNGHLNYLYSRYQRLPRPLTYWFTV